MVWEVKNFVDRNLHWTVIISRYTLYGTHEYACLHVGLYLLVTSKVSNAIVEETGMIVDYGNHRHQWAIIYGLGNLTGGHWWQHR